MTPADGADFQHETSACRSFGATCALLLHGGRVLLLFEAAERPPVAGQLIQGDNPFGWTAECWPCEAGGEPRWCGVAVLDTVPAADAEVCGAGARWRFAAAPRLDVAPELLAAHVRKAEVNGRDVFGFLIKHLLAGRPADSPEALAHRAFARSFVTAAAGRDGFIEIVGAPDSGGFFAQGWSMSLTPGTTILADAADDLALREVEVAVFDRDDILPPGHGFCFFGKFWSDANFSALESVFFERNGQLLRLDVARELVLRMSPERAREHVAHMLPRLRAPDETVLAFRRVCRPRFAGADTLSGSGAPIAAACDAVLRAPDGTLLILGWLLDPLRRVDRVLVKSTANLYGQLDAGWCALPRPDLTSGFAQDPRFANLLDERDVMHGFVAHAPARPEQTEGAQVYLELVLDDGSCLFRPLTVTPFDSAERLPQLLNGLAPAGPELARIIGTHLAPFLASVRPASSFARRGAAIRPIPLGDGTGARGVAAVVPFRSYAELQPLLALLAGTPEAEALELVLVTSRAIASEVLPRLGDAFRFYGLQGGLVVTNGPETVAAQLDLGVEASSGSRVLCWTPAALPKAAGWLARLLDEASALPVPGLLSPALTYEDGSVFFGGATGQPGEWLPRGKPMPVAAGAAEIALIDRAALQRVGGFLGDLFGDDHAHDGLADRLRRAGLATWCSGAVEFWMLDDPASDPGPLRRMMRQVDTALLGLRGRIAARERAA